MLRESMQERVERTRTRLMMHSPYFGEIAATMQMAEDEDIPTFRATRSALRYNPSWLAECSIAEVETLLAHAALRRVLEHEERGERRHDRIWHLATEYALNALLVDNGFELPASMRFNPRFKGMYAEEIYSELRESMMIEESEEEERTESPPEREHDAAPRESSERIRMMHGVQKPRKIEEIQEIDAELERAELERIFERLRRREELPEGLERLIPRYDRSRIDWREELRRYLGGLYKSAYRFSPPGIKHLYRGFALPSLHSEALELVIALDSSGSVDEGLLGEFLAEIESIMEQFEDYHIELIVADSKIRFHRGYGPGELLDYRLKGGGATDFRPVFSWIEESLPPPRLLLYFTDGAGVFPSHAPSYDVLWVLSRDASVPFGDRFVLPSRYP